MQASQHKNHAELKKDKVEWALKEVLNAEDGPMMMGLNQGSRCEIYFDE